ncbi:hypothetical protein DM02DRAFT_634564 [Periconia macrospinosa]|uniref:Uncharacterized protein n=1 Tax=Periconia macrospinosa TaxID=97972 RepID=A0A2V1D5R7_9PLEO|nr:hypothetical protein DM02DRAFT_634564 [Periconia macrospinosa]
MTCLPGTVQTPIVIQDCDSGDNSPPSSPLDGRSSLPRVDAEDAEADEETTLVDAEDTKVDEDITTVDSEIDGSEDFNNESDEGSEEESEPTPGAYLVSVRPEGTYYVCGSTGKAGESDRKA